MHSKVGFMLLVAALIGILAFFGGSGVRQGSTISYSAFSNNVNAGLYQSASIEGTTVYANTKKGALHIIELPATDAQAAVSDKLMTKGVPVGVKSETAEESNVLLLIAFAAVAGVILLGWQMSRVLRDLTNGAGGPAAAAARAQKSPAKLQTDISTRLNDVAGIDEVVSEVNEIVDYLKNPTRYTQLGGKLPRGVLMSGSPGSGKTLLARAIAGEAQVPFYSVSGSEFVEMFVGVGASRVRSMFDEAKKNAPCILFIDEIDSFARARGAGMGGSNDEREATLNQILVEMDGFDSNQTVIVIAATNRPDILDPALLRRFTRQVNVSLPDIKGREAILAVHTRSCPLDMDVDLAVLARSTPGFSGAELGNLVNEAAILAAREKATRISKVHFDGARDKLIMGLERKTLISEDDKRETAYHEAGHAVVGHIVGGDPIHKITIVPRGRALGLTVTLPEEDRYSLSVEEIHNRLAMLFGGRVAEEMFNKSVSTGASDDFARASQLARSYVAEWGFSKLGPMVVSHNRYDPNAIVSQATQREVDLEIRELIDTEMTRTRKILEENRDKMHKVVELLMLKETVDREEFLAIMNDTPIVVQDETKVDTADSTSV